MILLKVIALLLCCFTVNSERTMNFTAEGFNCFNSNMILNVSLSIGQYNDGDGKYDSQKDIIQENATVQLIQKKTTNEVIIHEFRIYRDIFVSQCGHANWPGKWCFSLALNDINRPTDTV